MTKLETSRKTRNLVMILFFALWTNQSFTGFFSSGTPTPPPPKPKPKIARPMPQQLSELSKRMLDKAKNKADNYWGDEKSKYLSENETSIDDCPCNCSLPDMIGSYPDIICWWYNIIKKRDTTTQKKYALLQQSDKFLF